MYVGHLTKEGKRRVEEVGSTFWTYECLTHGFSPSYARNFAGLFTWNAAAKGNFSWAYTHAHWGGGDYYMVEDGKVTITNGRYYAKAVPGPLGPMPTVGFEARREGVDDYRYLQMVRDEAAKDGVDEKLRGEIEKWLEHVKWLVRWYEAEGRHGVLLPDNNNFDDMDFFDPYPQMTPEKYDKVRGKAAAFILRLTGEGG